MSFDAKVFLGRGVYSNRICDLRHGGHLPLFVGPQRIILKLRANNSNFLTLLHVVILFVKEVR